MALTSLDERDLLLPLAEGIHERPLWRTFLRRLLARTRAQRVVLMVRTAEAEGMAPAIDMVAAAPAATVPDIDALSRSGLIPYAALRPNRAYALQEWLSPETDEARKQQMRLLGEQDIAHARFIRVRARGEHETWHDAWLILLHDRKDFGADDSALLSALAPHLASALGTLAVLDRLRLRAAMAEQALALLGIGQAALDREGRVLAADDLAATALDLAAGGRLPAADSAALASSCGELAHKGAPARELVRLERGQARDMLLRPAPPMETALPCPAAAVGAIRTAWREEPRSASRVVAATLGLSGGEAALAVGLSRGLSLVDAGAALNLTPETARNYSKRIYAKTGAAGQADLVRMALTGLAPLA